MLDVTIANTNVSPTAVAASVSWLAIVGALPEKIVTDESKAVASITVAGLGIDTVVKLVSAKANEPMEVTEAGISTDSNEVVPRNAAYSMEITESGIATVFKCVSKNTAWLMAAKEFEI